VKVSTALLISLGITALLTIGMGLIFGTPAFGIFLLLPLGFFFKKKDNNSQP
jgi:hypothetical protein